MIGLLDGDLVAFRCAATAENEEEWVAHARAKEFTERVLMEAGATSFELYLSGKNNFRYSIFPEYKKNRLAAYRPRWEKSTKDFLTENYGAVWYDKAEADDALAIRQTECHELGHDSVIVSIDKDMKQVPGLHYAWEQTRLGKVVSEAKFTRVSEIEGLRNFYSQLIIGDSADGIKGVPGAGKAAAKVLDDLHTEKDMFNCVREMYDCDEEMLMNGQVLWLWRKPNDVWKGLFD